MKLKPFYQKHQKVINAVLIIIVPIAIVTIFFLIKQAMNKSKTSTGNKGGVNNPGNLRNLGVKWLGATTKPGDVFESFADLKHGIMAMNANLKAYESLYGINTIQGIITRWAPSTDHNNTEAYISFVSSQTGISPNTIVSENDFPGIIAAISKEENNHPVTVDQVKQALA